MAFEICSGFTLRAACGIDLAPKHLACVSRNQEEEVPHRTSGVHFCFRPLWEVEMFARQGMECGFWRALEHKNGDGQFD